MSPHEVHDGKNAITIEVIFISCCGVIVKPVYSQVPQCLRAEWTRGHEPIDYTPVQPFRNRCPRGCIFNLNRIYCVVLQLSIKQGACAVFVDYRERQPEFIQREPSQALTT